MRHPLGSLIVMMFKNSGGRQIMRFNGDRDRLSYQLQILMAHPGYDLRVLEPLVKVPGSWTVLVETFETGAPGPFCGGCGVVVDDEGEYSTKENFFYCVDCAPK